MIRNFTIRKKIILLTILIITCAVMVSSAFFFYTYYTTLEKNAYDKLNLSIDQSVTSISNKFTDIDNTSFSFLSTSYMRSWQNREFDFTDDNSISYNNIANLRREIESSLMFNKTWLSKYIDTVYLFADNKCIYLVSRKAESLSQSQLSNQKVYDSTKNNSQMSFYYLSGKNSPTIYMVRKMNDITQKKQLTLIFTINSDSIVNELCQLNPNITASIVSGKTVFFSNNKSLIGTTSSDRGQARNSFSDEKSNFTVHRNLYNNLFFIEISVPKNSIMQQALPPLQYYIFVMIIFIVFFAAIAGLTAGIYTKFIKDLNMGLDQVRNKNYDVILPEYDDADLRNISNTFNNMTSEIKNLINSVYKSKILLKDSDIKLLQSQMNPHFLINTLTTISTTALLHKDEQVYRMVTSLSNILDGSLYNDDPFVTVEKELNQINCYLYIQSTRFQDKLRYSINIESDDLLKLYIPRLSIEPIVENSVIHGIEDNVFGGIVEIFIKRDGDDLIATVSDNGKGFNVENILQEHGDAKNGGHNIGINNTNKRIKLLFGESYGIRFESKPWVKTCAYIRFPVLKNAERRQVTDDKSFNC